jgi:hypothetical protein
MKKVKTNKITSLYKNPYSLLNQVIKKKSSANVVTSVPKSARPFGYNPNMEKKTKGKKR